MMPYKMRSTRKDILLTVHLVCIFQLPSGCAEAPSEPVLSFSPSEALENSRVSIVCEASGSPKPFMKLAKQDTGELIADGFSPLLHALPSVQCEEAGTYVCTADNDIGSSELTAPLYILCKPRITSPLQYIRVHNLTHTGAVSIHFDAIANPKPSNFTFTFLGQSLTQGSRTVPEMSKVKDIALGAYCRQKSFWGGPSYEASCGITVYNITSDEANGFYQLSIGNEHGTANYTFEVTNKGVAISACESGYTEVIEDSRNFTLTCDLYRGGVTWLYFDGAAGQTLGWCSGTYCRVTGRELSGLHSSSFTLTAVTESSSRLEFSRSATARMYGGFSYKCRDETSSASCQVDVVSPAVSSGTNTIFNKVTWTMRLQAHISSIYSSVGRYSCTWTLTYMGDQHALDADVTLTLTPDPDDVSNMADRSGHCILVRKVPSQPGTYRFFSMLTPGEGQNLGLTLNVARPTQPVIEGCTHQKYASQTQSVDVSCTCTTQSPGMPGGRLVWVTLDSNNSSKVTAVGDYGVTRLVLRSQGHSFVGTDVILFRCDVDWVETIRGHSYVVSRDETPQTTNKQSQESSSGDEETDVPASTPSDFISGTRTSPHTTLTPRTQDVSTTQISSVQQPRCTLPLWLLVSLAVSLAVLLALVVMVLVFLVWSRRRGWVMPCSEKTKETNSPVVLQTDEDGYLAPAPGFIGEPSRGSGGPYASVSMEDVGVQSPYDEIGIPKDGAESSH